MTPWTGSPYLDGARAPSTRREYRHCWTSWEAWCAVAERSSLPASPTTVAAYVVSRADAGDRVSTIRGRLAAIGAYHEDHGHDTPTRSTDVRRLLRGIGRSQADETPAQVAGLTAACMDAIEASINPKSRIHRENLALCWVMRDAMLRRSEAAALVWGDIEKDRDGSGRVLIRRSKTDQYGIGHVCYLSKAAMRSLAGISPAVRTGRVFPLHPRSIERRIAATARRAALPGRYRGHSPRVGMSLDLAENGASLVEMQQVGRWKSPAMPARYARAAMAKRSAVAKLYRTGTPAVTPTSTTRRRRFAPGDTPWLKESA